MKRAPFASELLILIAACLGLMGGGAPAHGKSAPNDEGAMKPVYLNIVWHQHQPLYLDPATDQLTGPWVRTHATKDYFDMAAMLAGYPDIHCTINLSSSLIMQLRDYYVARLGPYVNTKRNTFRADAFLKRWAGKTDPWIDLALKPAETFDSHDRDLLYRNPWNAFGVSDVQIARFPQYAALRRKLAGTPSPGDSLFTVQELREIIFWFYCAEFDPDFLRGPVAMPDGSTCDLSDIVQETAPSVFRTRREVRQSDCTRMVMEAVKVMKNILPVHRKLAYDPSTGKGRIEIITTPYYHPILPLICDTDLARVCQPNDSLPSRFSFPQDADAQVAKSVALYREIFGRPPSGMWPGEGSVAQVVLPVLRRHGVTWTASDVKVLNKSTPPDQENTTMFRFPAGKGKGISMVFRDTRLSDRIGFTYQTMDPEVAAKDFVDAIRAHGAPEGSPDVLITVILDGENAWEWYRRDMDGKKFLHALYGMLSEEYRAKRIVTTTPSEFIRGNSARGITSHPPTKQRAMASLWPGSWINGNFDTWIGEPEENRAWEYLLRARSDLGSSGIPSPDPSSPAPRKGTKKWYAWKAWEEIYAAEGSDWFWWYGDDQTAPGGDEPFDRGYRTHLKNVYAFARLAGAGIVDPGFAPIVAPVKVPGGQGTMNRSSDEMQTVVFRCDARGVYVPSGVFIAGNHPHLGSWIPNTLAMRDDGTGGDDTAGDGIWTFKTELPVGTEIQYKYTNSGPPGQWVPGEEFASRNRTFTIGAYSPEPFIIRDIFGQ
jgi:alpha-amylase/alpha-mannosidase (GH57 family)